MKPRYIPTITTKYDVLVHYADSVNYAVCDSFINGAQYRTRKNFAVTCLRCIAASVPRR